MCLVVGGHTFAVLVARRSLSTGVTGERVIKLCHFPNICSLVLGTQNLQ